MPVFQNFIVPDEENSTKAISIFNFKLNRDTSLWNRSDLTDITVRKKSNG